MKELHGFSFRSKFRLNLVQGTLTVPLWSRPGLWTGRRSSAIFRPFQIFRVYSSSHIVTPPRRRVEAHEVSCCPHNLPQ